jgi:hypothetical protein
MENQEPTKPTGNLEELFRHHLGEAVVPPSAYVWEQVDNALLVAQNETYRRRLVVTRWVAAASLLLATLAGTGWWLQRDFQPAGLATSPSGQPNDRIVPGSNRLLQANRMKNGGSQPNIATSSSANTDGSKRSTAVVSGSTFTPVRATKRVFSSGTVVRPYVSRHQLEGSAATTSLATVTPTINARASEPAASPFTSADETSSTYNTTTSSNHKIFTVAASAVAPQTLTGSSPMRASRHAAAGSGSIDANGLGLTAASALASSVKPTGKTGLPMLTNVSEGLENSVQNQAVGTAPLQSVLIAIGKSPLTPLPMPLAPQPGVAEQAPPTQLRHWRLGLAYTVGVFQSNVNFSRAGINPAYGYNPALGANSTVLSEVAAAEHRSQQRAGLSQRLRLQFSRRMQGRWTLATGLELAQQESHSATSYIFTGEQIPDLSQPLKGGPQQKTHARYRSAGLPVELSYANPVKTGVSLYGRVGAVVSALLNTRTDVEQEPEATRTYNLLSNSTPYRRLMGSIRGAAGIQFRPVGHDYTLHLGPVAEGGIWSMNRHPAEGFLSQSRPYSFGLEAGVEFGRNGKLSKL